MLNMQLQSRLRNWKFSQAQTYIDENVENWEKQLINSLASTFGNCGWMDGAMGTIINAAVWFLLPGTKQEDEDDGETND
jgi:hypothetical protein